MGGERLFQFPNKFGPTVICIPILLHKRTMLAFMKSVARFQPDATQFGMDKGVTGQIFNMIMSMGRHTGPCKQYEIYLVRDIPRIHHRDMPRTEIDHSWRVSLQSESTTEAGKPRLTCSGC